MCSARSSPHRRRTPRPRRESRRFRRPRRFGDQQSEALSRVLQELGISLPDIRDVNVQRVQVSGRDAYHITFTATGKPYSFYVDTHDGDLF